jgi:hypothetical protein
MKRRYKTIFFIIQLSIVWTLYGCGGGGSDSGPMPATVKVSASPENGTVSSGVTVSRTVEVQNIGDTFYTAFDLTYNPEVIQFVEGTEGTFLSQDGSDETSFQIALENGVPGRLTVGLTRMGPIGEVSGTGTLLALTFKAVGPGASPLAFQDPKGFRNGANEDIAIHAWQDGTVTVQ